MLNLITKFNLLVFLIIISLFVSCTNKNQEKIKSGPEIYITSPNVNDSYNTGSLIEIIALVADNINEVHDVTIKIKLIFQITKQTKFSMIIFIIQSLKLTHHSLLFLIQIILLKY